MMNAYESTMNFTRRAVWAQIDLDAAAHNMRQIRKHVGPDVKIAAVVKANAYGHGSVELAKTFAENGADCFAVSSLDEAVELRRYAHIDNEIFILGHTDARRTEELLTYDIEPAVFNLKNAEFFSQEARRLGKTLRVHIAVDTGMSRVGFQVNEFSVSEIKTIAALPNIEIRGMFTHFAVSDMKDKTFTREQYGHFRWMCKRMEEEGIHFKMNNDVDVRQLPEGFDAYCICTGAPTARDLPVPGRELKGIHPALDMLAQQNRILAGMTFPKEQLVTAKGKKVLVIGGGDTGSDCIGTSNRQGALSVTQIEIMPQPPVGQNPATPWPQFPVVLKTTSSHEEGCSRLWSLATRKFLGKNGKVCGVEVEQVEWTPDPDGGRPVMKPTGKVEVIEADLVLLAMGFLKPEHPQFTENVFVAGDAASGASLVVRAIASGRKAATDIDSYLNK